MYEYVATVSLTYWKYEDAPVSEINGAEHPDQPLFTCKHDKRTCAPKDHFGPKESFRKTFHDLSTSLKCSGFGSGLLNLTTTKSECEAAYMS